MAAPPEALPPPRRSHPAPTGPARPGEPGQGRGRVAGGVPGLGRRAGRGGGERGGEGRRGPAPRAGRLLRRLPGPDGGGRPRGLRRPDPPLAHAPARAPRAPRRPARALPVRAGGRVPGHEPCPARDAAAGRGRGGPQHHRGGRRRPGHLPLAGGGGREPAGFSRALPRGPAGGAGREPSIDPGDPRRGLSPHCLQQPVPAGGAGGDRQALALHAARGSGPGTSASWCAAMATPILSCAPST